MYAFLWSSILFYSHGLKHNIEKNKNVTWFLQTWAQIYIFFLTLSAMLPIMCAKILKAK